MLEVKKREGEPPAALIARFTKRIKQSGVLKEARKRRFYKRTGNRRKRLLSAIHRDAKKTEYERLRKLGGG